MDLGTIKRLFRNLEHKYRIRTGISDGFDTVLGTGTIIGTLAI